MGLLRWLSGHFRNMNARAGESVVKAISEAALNEVFRALTPTNRSCKLLMGSWKVPEGGLEPPRY
jgi:hypothetical protein